MNFNTNGECGAPVTGNDLNFGSVSGNVTQANEATLRGWGVRQSDWQWGINAATGGDPARIGGCRLQPAMVQGGQGHRQHGSRRRGL